MTGSTSDEEAVEPIDPDVIFGMILVCIASGGVLLSAYVMPDIVGGWFSAEVVLAAGMVFAATFLITVSLFPESDEDAPVM